MAALIACAVYGDTWLINAQRLENHWSNGPVQCFVHHPSCKFVIVIIYGTHIFIYSFILTDERPVVLQENGRVSGERNKAELDFNGTGNNTGK